MKPIIKSQKDFYAGLMYTTFGIAAALIAQHYKLGSAVRMGPAYFPMIISVLLTLVGMCALLRGVMRQGDSVKPFAWRQLALVLGGVVLFGLLVRGAGLVPATLALVLVSAFASPKFKLKTAFFLAVSSAIFCTLVFSIGLRLPFPALGTWFGL